MKRGKIDWRLEEHNLSITKWMDNKVVYFISNMHNPEKSEGVSRKTKDGTEVVIGENQVNKDYNKHMSNVDKADMLKSLLFYFIYFISISILLTRRKATEP